LAISPLKVLGEEIDIKKIEKKIEKLEQSINLKSKEFNKMKKSLINSKKSVEELKKVYMLNKQKGIKTSFGIIKKIKEYDKIKEKALKLQKEIESLKNEIEILKETLDNLQNVVFVSKIISFSPWVAFNRVEFDLIEPPIKLKYDTKGNEGACGFKLKDFGDIFKIVKIKVKNDSST